MWDYVHVCGFEMFKVYLKNEKRFKGSNLKSFKRVFLIKEVSAVEI